MYCQLLLYSVCIGPTACLHRYLVPIIAGTNTAFYLMDLLPILAYGRISHEYSSDYTLCSGVHVYWSEHSDSSFVYGFMSLDYGFGTMTATTLFIIVINLMFMFSLCCID